MANNSKRTRKNQERVDPNRTYALEEAITTLKSFTPAKFDETVEIAVKLTVDPKRQDPKVARHYFRMKDGVEKKLGEWNQYEITCKGDTIKLVINGQLVNEGTGAELKRGKILLQSEGAEIFFRNVELKSLK